MDERHRRRRNHLDRTILAERDVNDRDRSDDVRGRRVDKRRVDDEVCRIAEDVEPAVDAGHLEGGVVGDVRPDVDLGVGWEEEVAGRAFAVILDSGENVLGRRRNSRHRADAEEIRAAVLVGAVQIDAIHVVADVRHSLALGQYVGDFEPGQRRTCLNHRHADLGIRHDIAVDDIVGILCRERIGAGPDLPAVPHSVAIGIDVVGIGADLLFLVALESVAVAVGHVVFGVVGAFARDRLLGGLEVFLVVKRIGGEVLVDVRVLDVDRRHDGIAENHGVDRHRNRRPDVGVGGSDLAGVAPGLVALPDSVAVAVDEREEVGFSARETRHREGIRAVDERTALDACYRVAHEIGRGIRLDDDLAVGRGRAEVLDLSRRLAAQAHRELRRFAPDDVGRRELLKRRVLAVQKRNAPVVRLAVLEVPRGLRGDDSLDRAREEVGCRKRPGSREAVVLGHLQHVGRVGGRVGREVECRLRGREDAARVRARRERRAGRTRLRVAVHERRYDAFVGVCRASLVLGVAENHLVRRLGHGGGRDAHRLGVESEIRVEVALHAREEVALMQVAAVRDREDAVQERAILRGVVAVDGGADHPDAHLLAVDREAALLLSAANDFSFAHGVGGRPTPDDVRGVRRRALEHNAVAGVVREVDARHHGRDVLELDREVGRAVIADLYVLRNAERLRAGVGTVGVHIGEHGEVGRALLQVAVIRHLELKRDVAVVRELGAEVLLRERPPAELLLHLGVRVGLDYDSARIDVLLAIVGDGEVDRRVRRTRVERPHAHDRLRVEIDDRAGDGRSNEISGVVIPRVEVDRVLNHIVVVADRVVLLYGDVRPYDAVGDDIRDVFNARLDVRAELRPVGPAVLVGVLRRVI